MNTSTDPVIALINWLLQNSAYGGVAIVFVLIIHRIFGLKLKARWRHALWWLVLVRLILPFSLATPISLYRFFRANLMLEDPTRVTPIPQPTTAAVLDFHILTVTPGSLDYVENLSQAPSQPQAAPPSGTALARHPTPAFQLWQFPESAYRLWSIPGLIIAVWLSGVLTLLICLSLQMFRFRKKLRKAGIVIAPPIIHLFSQCCEIMSVRRSIILCETDAVTSPALFGFLTPRLLIPKEILKSFSETELRCVFLHELAHVKRKDILTNWLMTGLQMLHWFNPMVWMAFARMRADRELACDDLALSHTKEGEAKLYGQTIIKLLEGFTRPAPLPGLVGIIEDAKQMKRRIRMIARFQNGTRWPWLPAALLIVIGVIVLTDAQIQTPVSNPSEKAGSHQSDTHNAAATDEKEISKSLGPASTRAMHVAPNGKTAVAGVVHGPDGKPVEKAMIYPEMEQHFELTHERTINEKFQPFGLSTVQLQPAVTSWNGTFQLNHALSAENLVAIHSSGIARVSLKELSSNSTIQLQPWGRVEGVLRTSGNHPGAGLKVALTGGKEFGVFMQEYATADQDGNFSFEKVPPGAYSLYRYSPATRTSRFGNYRQWIEVHSNQTTTVRYGGLGRSVIGKIPIKAPVYGWDDCSIGLFQKFNGSQMLDEAGRPVSHHSNAFQAGSQSPYCYQVEMGADGIFHIDDVVAGSYQLHVLIPHLVERPEFVSHIYDDLFTSTEISIPPIQEGNNNEPFDLGMIKLTDQATSGQITRPLRNTSATP